MCMLWRQTMVKFSKVFSLLTAALALTTTALFAEKLPENCSQLILVRSPTWDSIPAKAQCFRKSRRTGKWIAASRIFDVSLGKTGLAWGRGLHDFSKVAGPIKQEGDMKAPAGIFALGLAFGKKSLKEIEKERTLRMPYIELTPNVEGVDDPDSKYYNQIIDRTSVDVDWNSAEKMFEIDLYGIGLEVLHNSPVQCKDAGSAIYIHLWRGLGRPTAGCTGMSQENIESLFYWVDSAQNPLLVQLPEEEFQRLQFDWGLPNFVESD